MENEPKKFQYLKTAAAAATSWNFGHKTFQFIYTYIYMCTHINRLYDIVDKDHENYLYLKGNIMWGNNTTMLRVYNLH
jgi:hypothetical protein